MPRKLALTLLVFGYASCMEMRETIERKVMVRTTGSDLQPAATGYIYKKESNSPASVIKMEETDVMEHLSKLYDEPEHFTAAVPTPKGPFHEEPENKSSNTKEVVIPVFESEEADDDDGIADEVYGNIFKDYHANIDKSFAEYLNHLNNYGHGIFKQGDTKDYVKEYDPSKGVVRNHKYDNPGSDDYDSEKYKSFYIPNEGNGYKYHDDAKIYEQIYKKGNGYKGSDHRYADGESTEKEVDKYYKHFNKDQDEKGHGVRDDKKDVKDFSKFRHQHEYYGGDAGGADNDADKSGHHQVDFGKGGYVLKESGNEEGTAHSGEQGNKSSDHYEQENGSKSRAGDVKGFHFEIKH